MILRFYVHPQGSSLKSPEKITSSFPSVFWDKFLIFYIKNYIRSQNLCGQDIISSRVFILRGCLFSREKAVNDVNTHVGFCFLVGVYLDLDWSRKN